MEQIQLKSIPKHYSGFAIYMMYSENMDIVYMAIFQMPNHYKEKEAFMDCVEIQNKILISLHSNIESMKLKSNSTIVDLILYV